MVERSIEASCFPAALRRAIRTIEARGMEGEARAIPFGVAAIDAVLGGGLACGMLHEVSASENEIAAATGFALALAARPVPAPGCGEGRGEGERASGEGRHRRPLLWIAEDMALAESGAPYGPGLDEFGLAPERLILVRVAQSRDVPWAMEEALRCRAVGAVIGELRGRLDLVASRRLSLAAARGGATALLLRAGSMFEPSAAATRWIVGAAPSPPAAHGLGAPRFALRLTRNRRGQIGSWLLEWNRAEQRFDAAPAHIEPVAQKALDRPHRAAMA